MENFFTTIWNILTQEADNFSRETRKTYKFELSKFKRFSPQLQCNQITEEVILAYKEYMRQLGNSENTISKSLACLKTLINKARSAGLMTNNPFAKIRIRKIHSTRRYLDCLELKILDSAFRKHHSRLSVSEYDAVLAFLFSCYTGLRYSDLKSLTASEIQNQRIRKKMHKTGDFVYIPMPEQAIMLLELASHDRKDYVLKITENSFFNRNLRSGAKKLGFSKHIHCHIARHTFATTCLTLGIPLEVTSKLLGHRDVATTMIYAKYVDKVLDSEMEKFNYL